MKRLAVLCLMLAGCATTPGATGSAPDAFMNGLRSLCGASYPGRMVTADPADTVWVGQAIRVSVTCARDGSVRMPLSVGADRSRTWVVSRTATGVRLKHDHRHADGTADPITNYGGDTAEPGTVARQAFTADAESIALFRERGNPASVDNVWALEVRPGLSMAYELRRPNRHFRVEFDLAQRTPIAP